MMTYWRNTALVLFITACLPGLGNNIQEEPRQKPNIIIFYVDDLGWRDVGFMGSSFYETPHLDQLANQGVIFTDAYANAPNCAPSRACLLSGLYSPRHGVYTVGSSERGKSENRKIIPVENKTMLDTRFTTFAEILKGNGYQTVFLGKWHLGAGEKGGPESQGFDLNIGGNHLGHPSSYFSPYKNPNLPDRSEGEYLTDRLTVEAMDFLTSHDKNQPFLMMLSHYAVHTPIQAKPDLINYFKEKEGDPYHHSPAYAAMIKSIDESFGKLLNGLREKKMEDNTVIIFASDNGGYGPITSMSPLKGAKGMPYEGGIRVPMFIWYPKLIKRAREESTPVIGTDVYPTILDLAGIEKPDDLHLDGESLVVLLKGEKQADKSRNLYWHFPAYLQANMGGGGPWRITPSSIIRSGDWKLIRYYEDQKVELFNLATDIGENKELSSTYPKKAEELLVTLDDWISEVNAPITFRLNPEYKVANQE